MNLREMPRFHIILAVLVLLALSSISILAFAPVLPSTVSHISSRPSAGGRRSSSLQLQVASTSPAVDWSFLDAVYLITASPNGKPASRVETVRIELEKAGLWDKTLVKAFKTDDEDRVRGCCKSTVSSPSLLHSRFSRPLFYCRFPSPSLLMRLLPYRHILTPLAIAVADVCAIAYPFYSYFIPPAIEIGLSDSFGGLMLSSLL
jgi:hypothetical protein